MEAPRSNIVRRRNSARSVSGGHDNHSAPPSSRADRPFCRLTLWRTRRTAMEDHVLVSREDWTAARLEVLAQEKALTRHADALAAKRRAATRLVDSISATVGWGRRGRRL